MRRSPWRARAEHRDRAEPEAAAGCPAPAKVMERRTLDPRAPQARPHARMTACALTGHTRPSMRCGSTAITAAARPGSGSCGHLTVFVFSRRAVHVWRRAPG